MNVLEQCVTAISHWMSANRLKLNANTPKTTTDKLQRILNAAARVITATRKFDRGLTHILHDKLHWLDVPQRVAFKLCTTV